MALLNYYSGLYNDENFIKFKLSEIYNKLQLIFTEDRHLLTHDIDFLQDYVGGNRGLVPSYPDANTNTYKVFAQLGWENLTINHLPLHSQGDYDNNTLLTSKLINDLINASYVANDAMLFKGTIGTEGATVSELPKTPNIGWTYRVTTSNTYGGYKCEVGDLIICVKEWESETSPAEWTVAQTNINGTSTVTINGTPYLLYSNTNGSTEFYAPSSVGSADNVLVSDGTTLTWKHQNALVASDIIEDNKKKLFTELTAANGEISISVGGTKKTATASGNWNINAATANKVNNALKLGTGLTFGTGITTYDGSSERTITLVPATGEVLGGVKIGEHISVDANGKISLTKDNITEALGFVPENVLNSVVVSKTTKGLAPMVPESYANASYSYAFLAYNNEAEWVTLPETAWTCRPVQINNTEILAGNNTSPLILKNGNLIEITKNDDGLVVIGTTAEKNQNAFSTINVGNSYVKASSVEDSVIFLSDDSTVAISANSKTINFKVPKFTEADYGLVPKSGDSTKYLRGDGAWETPINTWRPVKYNTTTLNDAATTLEFVAGKEIALSFENGKLTIASTYTPHIYNVGTGLDKVTEGTTSTFTLKAATSGELGGIKVGYSDTSENTRNYAVLLDSNNKAFVSVPWTDTSVRDVQINGESIGTTTALNFIPTNSVQLVVDNTNTNAREIGFDIAWYNIADNKTEIL